MKLNQLSAQPQKNIPIHQIPHQTYFTSIMWHILHNGTIMNTNLLKWFGKWPLVNTIHRYGSVVSETEQVITASSILMNIFINIIYISDYLLNDIHR